MLACHPKPKSGGSFPDDRFASRHGTLVRSASRPRRLGVPRTSCALVHIHGRYAIALVLDGGSALHRAGRVHRKTHLPQQLSER